MNTINSKKLYILLTFVYVSLSLLVKSQPICECQGSTIEQSDLDRYKANYDRIFAKNDPADKKHTKWIYLPKTYLSFLNTYFNIVNADGIWIYFVTNGKIIDSRQQSDSRQIFINIAASVKGKPEFENFSAAVAASTVLKSNNIIHLSTRKSSSSLSSIGHTKIMGFSEPEVTGKQFSYAEENAEVKYSFRVHICRDHISQLKEAIDKSLGKWNGIKLYFGSYDEIIACTKNANKEQLTLILVPVKNQNDDGNITEYNNFLKSKHFRSDDIYNHGELCPEKCVPEN